MEPLANMTFAQVSAEFPDEPSAHAYFEAIRWPNGVRCAHCGSAKVYDAKANRKRPIWKCKDCKKQFSISTNTVMESSKLPLRTWLLAFFLLSAHRKSVSSHQLSRDLGVSLKAAWFLSHRIREAMREKGDPLYGAVEADHTYLGGKKKRFGRGYVGNKIPVHGVVSRSKGGKGRKRGAGPKRFAPGQARLIALRKGTNPDQNLTAEQITDNVIPDESILNTDETPLYDNVGKRFVDHQKVNHGEGEYVRGDAYTNTAEGLFANMKRQIEGTHHSISEQHSQRYMDEHAFRYNHRDETDGEKFVRAVRGGEGKRLRLFKPTRGKAPSLRKRQHDGPAQEPWKGSRAAKGLSARGRRLGRKTARKARVGDMRDALALLAKKQARESGGGDGGE